MGPEECEVVVVSSAWYPLRQTVVGAQSLFRGSRGLEIHFGVVDVQWYREISQRAWGQGGVCDPGNAFSQDTGKK